MEKNDQPLAFGLCDEDMNYCIIIIKLVNKQAHMSQLCSCGVRLGNNIITIIRFP